MGEKALSQKSVNRAPRRRAELVSRVLPSFFVDEALPILFDGIQPKTCPDSIAPNLRAGHPRFSENRNFLDGGGISLYIPPLAIHPGGSRQGVRRAGECFPDSSWTVNYFFARFGFRCAAFRAAILC